MTIKNKQKIKNTTLTALSTALSITLIVSATFLSPQPSRFASAQEASPTPEETTPAPTEEAASEESETSQEASEDATSEEETTAEATATATPTPSETPTSTPTPEAVPLAQEASRESSESVDPSQLCKFDEQPNRTIVEFKDSNGVAPHLNQKNPDTDITDVNLDKGRYRVTVCSYDLNHPHQNTQSNERWFVRLFDSSGKHRYTSKASKDLADDDIERTDVVAENMAIFHKISSVQGRHTKQTSNNHSISAAAVAFDRLDPATPTPQEVCFCHKGASGSDPDQRTVCTADPSEIEDRQERVENGIDLLGECPASTPTPTPANNSPTLQVPDSIVMEAGQVLGKTITARDIDGDQITITIDPTIAAGQQFADFCQL